MGRQKNRRKSNPHSDSDPALAPGAKAKTILDLSNELLSHIARELNPHFRTPLPSFVPHGRESVLDDDEDEFPIIMSKNRDILAFILVCKRFREVVSPTEYMERPLDLFYVLKNGDKIVNYSYGNRTMSPMDISRLHVKWPANPHEPPEQMWNAFFDFLRRAVDLEELHISQMPCCYHDPNPECYPTKSTHPSDQFMFEAHDIKIPRDLELANLVSFVNDVKCRRCHEMVNLIIGRAPNLEHLKCAAIDYRVETKTNPPDPEGYHDDKKNKVKAADYLIKSDQIDKQLDRAGFGIPQELRGGTCHTKPHIGAPYRDTFMDYGEEDDTGIPDHRAPREEFWGMLEYLARRNKPMATSLQTLYLKVCGVDNLVKHLDGLRFAFRNLRELVITCNEPSEPFSLRQPIKVHAYYKGTGPEGKFEEWKFWIRKGNTWRYTYDDPLADMIKVFGKFQHLEKLDAGIRLFIHTDYHTLGNEDYDKINEDFEERTGMRMYWGSELDEEMEAWEEAYERGEIDTDDDDDDADAEEGDVRELCNVLDGTRIKVIVRFVRGTKVYVDETTGIAYDQYGERVVAVSGDIYDPLTHTVNGGEPALGPKPIRQPTPEPIRRSPTPPMNVEELYTSATKALTKMFRKHCPALREFTNWQMVKEYPGPRRSARKKSAKEDDKKDEYEWDDSVEEKKGMRRDYHRWTCSISGPRPTDEGMAKGRKKEQGKITSLTLSKSAEQSTYTLTPTSPELRKWDETTNVEGLAGNKKRKVPCFKKDFVCHCKHCYVAGADKVRKEKLHEMEEAQKNQKKKK